MVYYPKARYYVSSLPFLLLAEHINGEDHMTFAFDWQTIEDRLFEESQTTIVQFALEHPDVICSFFAYGVDLDAGYFLPSFDTPENSIRQAQRQEAWAIQSRNQMLNQDWSWRYASNTIKVPRLVGHSPGIDSFAYHMYAELYFSELVQLRENANYPSKNNEIENDYVDGNVYILLWKVVERLIASHAFDRLSLATPFLIGSEFHEDELRVLRILNWPISGYFC